MAEERDPATIAREIVDQSLYMVVSTADQSGQPWASPVFYAPTTAYRDYFWVSAPEATHSRNLRERREVGIVIFDSSTPLNEGQGVYILGVGRELPAHETTEGIGIFSKRSKSHGGEKWAVEDVRDPSQHRLYQATAEAVYVLDEDDHRVEIPLSKLG